MKNILTILTFILFFSDTLRAIENIERGYKSEIIKTKVLNGTIYVLKNNSIHRSKDQGVTLRKSN